MCWGRIPPVTDIHVKEIGVFALQRRKVVRLPGQSRSDPAEKAQSKISIDISGGEPGDEA